MFKFATLGSGSRGNATIVCAGDQCLLIDCGFTLKELERRLGLLSLLPSDLTAVLVTHEHSDHIKGVGPLSRKYLLPVYMTCGSHMSGKCGELFQFRQVEHGQPFTIGDVHVTPVAVPHDAREPSQYVLEYAGRKLGVLTDLGMITPHVLSHYQKCHGLLVEANHDVVMLANGPYPPTLRQRVGSNWGHLNNGQTAEFLAAIDQSVLQHVLVGHISEKNNHLSSVDNLVSPHVHPSATLNYAVQDQTSAWFELR